MSTCKHCGTKFDDSIAFCPMCGTNVLTNRPAYTQKEPISVGGWIGRTLIPCIPLVGGIVYLIMLFVWSGDTKKEDTFRNWAKAQLIVMAIVLVLVIIGVILGVTVFSDVLGHL
jgi:hypothetical protein